MRDKRLIAVHKGGLLTKEQHQSLVLWACDCVENVMMKVLRRPRAPITRAISTARAWANGEASVGDCRNMSVAVIALARGLKDPALVAIARAAGHAVATPHMADHAIRAARYALKSLSIAGFQIEAEKARQLVWLQDDLAFVKETLT